MTAPIADAAFWLAVACCMIAQVAIVRSAFARRSPIAGTATMPPLRRPVEVAWTLLPAVILALVLWLTWRAMHDPAAVMIVDAQAAVGSVAEASR